MSARRMRLGGWWLVVLGLAVGGCGGSDEEVEYYGEFFLDNDFGKADSVSSPGIPVGADDTETAVWTVKNDWNDTNTANAKLAGLAWGANSGLTWDQKYALWVESLPKIDNYAGSYKTFTITNPQGKTLQAPVLECAETAIFLRVTFSSWYNLPMFLQAVDSDGTRVFMGHFGWRTASGRYKNSNKFRDAYADYSGRSVTEANWPRDEKLRAKKLYGSDDDMQPFLGDGARAGTFFDELFLNKRVGHMLILMLSNFGSIHLADSANTYNLKPEAVREGDVLLERWQKNGIGHTLVVKDVRPGLNPEKLQAELVSGSMPRRQGKWEDEVASKRYFTAEETGGLGSSWDGDEYAKLGGGLKRWRVARKQEGRYVNTILPGDINDWVSSTNYAAIGARPGQFEELLEEVSPEQKRDALLAIIEDKRVHLRNYPASCSARTGRESAFDELYELMQSKFYTGKEEVDRRYRRFEDYVFAELVYTESKTCCWNSSTAAMYEIVMDFELGLVRGGTGCVRPVVFMNDGGYGVFADHAAALGRSGDWLPWTEDEPCAQRATARDLEAEHHWTDFCTIRDALLLAQGCTGDEQCDDGVGCTVDQCAGGVCQHLAQDSRCAAGQRCDSQADCVASGCTDDAYEDNDSRAAAAAVPVGTTPDLVICSGDDDWYSIAAQAGTLHASIAFLHASGDLDMELTDAAGTVLANSQTMNDTETVEVSVDIAATFQVHVYGYNGAAGPYSLTVENP